MSSSFLGRLNFTVCFVQEVHLRDRGDVVGFTREWGRGGAVWSVGGVHSSGVGILFGGGGVRVEGSFMISQGRAVGADICVGDLKLRVICVYGPQGRGSGRA